MKIQSTITFQTESLDALTKFSNELKTLADKHNAELESKLLEASSLAP